MRQLKLFAGRAGIAFALALLATSATPGHAQDDDAPRFSDGDWTGSYFSSRSFQAGDLTWSGEVTGTASVVAAGGQITGSWEEVGNGEVQAQSGVGTATYTANGTLVGPYAAPQMLTTLVVGDTTVTAAAGTFTIPIQYSGSDIPPNELTLVSVTCELLRAEMTSWIAPIVTGLDNASNLPMTLIFVEENSLRTPDAQDYLKRVKQLLQDADRFILTVEDQQTVDSAALVSLLDRAENLRRELIQADDCALRKSSRTAFQLMIAGMIGDLIELTSYRYDVTFSTRDLVRLANAARRAGLFEPGSSTSPTGEFDYINLMGAEFNNRAVEAEEEGNCGEAQWALLGALLTGDAEAIETAQDIVQDIC